MQVLGFAPYWAVLVKSSCTVVCFLYIFLKTDVSAEPLRQKPGTPLFLYTFGAEVSYGEEVEIGEVPVW